MARIQVEINNSGCSTTLEDIARWEDEMYEMQTIMNWLNEECDTKPLKDDAEGRSYVEVTNDTPFNIIYLRALGRFIENGEMEHRFVIESGSIPRGSRGRLYFDVKMPAKSVIVIDGNSVDYPIDSSCSSISRYAVLTVS